MMPVSSGQHLRASELTIVLTLLALKNKTKQKKAIRLCWPVNQPELILLYTPPPLHRAGKANGGLKELRSAEGVKGEE